MLVDTHCHIHEAWQSVNGNDATAKLWVKAGSPSADDLIARAVQEGVTCMICVGTTLPDSKMGIEFVARRDHVWASIGIHPHEAKDYADSPKKLAEFMALATRPKVVAIGECGLDYYYAHSPKAQQKKILHAQLALAAKHHLPVIFHVREAFADFWPIFDSYPGLGGVIHSFSAGELELEQIVKRGLYVGLNGIMTFTKDAGQLAAAKAVPLNQLLLETDAPFLTPSPYRGTICEPKHVRVTAEFVAKLRGESIAELAAATTQNARTLFGF